MQGTVPILLCDDECGCDEWIVDNYEMGASNWRYLLAGWSYDPYRDRDAAFCPEHAAQLAGTTP